MLKARGFTRNIRPYVEEELALARSEQNYGNKAEAFAHLENAHVIGQASTRLHVKVHVQMLLWAVKQGKIGEFLVNFSELRALPQNCFWTDTCKNTGGANVSPFKVMPIKPELRQTIKKSAF